jgi:hypothetical protein
MWLEVSGVGDRDRIGGVVGCLGGGLLLYSFFPVRENRKENVIRFEKEKKVYYKHFVFSSITRKICFTKRFYNQRS